MLKGADEILPVYNDHGAKTGELVPVGHKTYDLKTIARLLSKWRDANKKCFLTEFDADEERTLAWIRATLINSETQRLYLVVTQGQIVGHFGYKNLTSDSVLLDNTIRGEPGGEAKLFVYAGQTLVNWLFQHTSVSKVHGLVFTDNIPGIMMNRQIGFTGWQKVNFRQTNVGNDMIWQQSDHVENDGKDRRLYQIHIDRDGLV